MGYSNKTEEEQRQGRNKRQERLKGFPGVKGDVQGVQLQADVYGVSWGQRRYLIGPLMICVAVQYRGFKGVEGRCLVVHAGHLGVQGVGGT